MISTKRITFVEFKIEIVFYTISETPGKFNKLGNSSVESALAIGVGGTRPGPGTSLEFNRRPPLPDEGVPTAPRIRKDFSETWLWQSIDDDK